MVEFKKDKGKKENRIKELMGYMSIFFSGFIIALFLVMYVVLFTVNLLINNNKEDNKENNEPISNEPLSNSEEDNNVDKYINEKALLTNLLSVCKEYEPSVNSINNITYDTDYMYITLSGEHDLFILSGELDGRSVDEVLESLITSTSSFEIYDLVRSYDIDSRPSIDISTLDIFKNDERYKDYVYKCKSLYYIDDYHNEVGLASIGKKSNEYIVFNRLTYVVSSETLIDIPSGFRCSTNDSSSEYYKVIDYLYSL